MRFFPQVSQFPIRKRRRARTVRNRCQDGREIKLADAAEARVEWRLEFAELTDGELAALRQCFEDSEGSLGDFTFLDPTSNLLAWSEKLEEPAWQCDPLMQLTGGMADPFAGTGAFRVQNGGAAPLGLRQTLNVPGWFWYAVSVYARSDAAGSLTLLRGTERREYELLPVWRRLVFSANAATAQESVAFGLELQAGGSADVFGFQVEAQTAASAYKKTLSRSGVYANARFRDDALALTTAGPGRHGCLIVIDANSI